MYSGTTIAAVGIACHEAGHAIQYAKGYAPIKMRNKLIPITNIGSNLGLILILLGIVLSNTLYFAQTLVLVGIALYSFVVLLQLVTLPVEFNASRRALSVISETGMLNDIETEKAKQVLSAAAMTYVAALLVSIMSLLRLILRTRNRRN